MTEFNKTTGHRHTGRADVNEGLPKRILNESPESNTK
jgi:hypothetical protein